MLIGAAIKNYKVYKNLQYVPISFGSEFSAFLGPNGIGKTSIFEALDKFFNGGDWSVNSDAKKGSDEAFVAPLFLIPIDKLSLNKKERRVASLMSDYFWNYSTVSYTSFIKHIKDAITILSVNQFTPATHFLLMLGVKHPTGELHIPYFENDIRKILDGATDVDYSDVEDLLRKIKLYYRYIYLPAEADSLDFTKMESIYVQKLLDEDIKKTIQNAISKDAVKEINEKLKQFIDQINGSLERYVYKGKRKDQLTINDLIDRIFSAYFGIKVLHKKIGTRETIIKDLSSGEKRQALIDLSYALISRSAEKEYQVVLAIDEPDASMHVAACHDQFEKIARIPSLLNPKPQVLVNTHWYGFIPIIRSGIAHSLSRSADAVDFFSFNLENFREHINQNMRKSSSKYPKEVELKSYQDMIQSVVVSMLRDDPYNWIFCEGLSDKIYLDHYLSDLVEKKSLRVVPLGGFKQVRRVYAYLAAPLGDKEAGFKGKALCLVDTDAQRENVELTENAKPLHFKRIVRDESSQKIQLVDADSQLSFPTEIEFSLREEVFLQMLKSVALTKMGGCDVLNRIVSETKVVVGSNNLYDYLNLGPQHKKEIMDKFFDLGDNKVTFAKAYVASDTAKIYEPEWIGTIRKIFTS